MITSLPLSFLASRSSGLDTTVLESAPAASAPMKSAPGRAGKIGLPGAMLPNRRRALLSALLFCCTFARAQTIAFELQTHLDSPITLVNYTPATFRIESDRRQFLTVKNESDRVAIAVVFQQTISNGSKTEIVALERVSIVIGPREKKRLSVSVQDMWSRIQSAVKSGDTIGKLELGVVVVEFIDGSSWSAPPHRARK